MSQKKSVKICFAQKTSTLLHNLAGMFSAIDINSFFNISNAQRIWQIENLKRNDINCSANEMLDVSRHGLWLKSVQIPCSMIVVSQRCNTFQNYVHVQRP